MPISPGAIWSHGWSLRAFRCKRPIAVFMIRLSISISLCLSRALPRCAFRRCSDLLFAFLLFLLRGAQARLATREDRAHDLRLVLAIEAAAADAVLRNAEGNQDANGPNEHADGRELSVARAERVLSAASARGATTTREERSAGATRCVGGNAARVSARPRPERTAFAPFVDGGRARDVREPRGERAPVVRLGEQLGHHSLEFLRACGRRARA